MDGQEFTVGTEVWFAVDSPSGRYSAFFEDDGEAGYFYAYDLKNSARPILDAVHIYTVERVVDRDRPSIARILWSDDGLKCALTINRYPHAVFDFGARRGYCRTNFPNFARQPEVDWLTSDHNWSDGAADWLPK